DLVTGVQTCSSDLERPRLAEDPAPFLGGKLALETGAREIERIRAVRALQRAAVGQLGEQREWLGDHVREFSAAERKGLEGKRGGRGAPTSRGPSPRAPRETPSHPPQFPPHRSAASALARFRRPTGSRRTSSGSRSPSRSAPPALRDKGAPRGPAPHPVATSPSGPCESPPWDPVDSRFPPRKRPSFDRIEQAP